MISEERRHYDLTKHLDVILEPKVELITSEVNPSIDFTIVINNNSDELVELDRVGYWVLFKVPLEGQETHEFQQVGKGYSIFKGIMESREKKRCKLAFEISHSKVIAICKAMREARNIEGKLQLEAYFNRCPTLFPCVLERVGLPISMVSWKFIEDFPPIGWVTKLFDFLIPLDTWENFVDKVRQSI